MKSGIYMIINLSNNKVYVGSSKNLARRKWEHFNLLKNNKHKNNYLQSSYNKYGENMFKFIITENCKIEELIIRERYWIDIKKSNESKYGYNLSIPEEKGGFIITEVTRDKLRRIGYKTIYGELTEQEYQQKLIEKEEYNNREKIDLRKKVFGFDKLTGELSNTFNSVAEVGDSGEIYKVLDNLKYSYKGMVLIREENYNPEIIYKQIMKERKVYEKKGVFKGRSIETFNLETKDLIQNYDNKHHIAEVFSTSVNYINKVFSGEKKSFRGMGIRYSS